MEEHAYSGRPTRNPFRFLLALWRTMRDPSRTDEVAIVEIGFARSRLGRRFARWQTVLSALSLDAQSAPALAERREFGPVDLDALGRLPGGTLGRVFADHCRARSLNPNLVHIAGDGEEDWLLRHLYGTHDVWHVATGWGNDETGEVGLGAFYLGQLEAPFFVFLLALLMLNTVFVAPSTLRDRMDALAAGYAHGRQTQPLFGTDWEALWEVPLDEVRRRFGLEGARIVGEGIRSAA